MIHGTIVGYRCYWRDVFTPISERLRLKSVIFIASSLVNQVMTRATAIIVKKLDSRVPDQVTQCDVDTDRAEAVTSAESCTRPAPNTAIKRRKRPQPLLKPLPTFKPSHYHSYYFRFPRRPQHRKQSPSQTTKMRGNAGQTKMHFKGQNDDFVIFVESKEAVQNWKKDRSTPLAQVVSGFKIFVTHK